MKRVFISTNYNKLQFIIGERRNELGINLLNSEDNHVLIFSEGTFKAYQANPTQVGYLFLVNDSSNLLNNSGNPIISINKEKDDYLMRHNTCNHEALFKKDNIHRKGMHEEGDPFYGYVFNDVILNNNISADQKALKIIEFLFPTSEIILGKKLDLLHNLLVPPVDFKKANEYWEELKKIVEIAKESGINVSLASDENALADFETEAKEIKEAFDPKYLESLRTLRDKLLVS